MSSLTTTDRLKDLLPQLFNPQQVEGDYYLRFQLTGKISALIDLNYVQESLTVNSDQITAVPNLPEFVVGLMSSRNQIFLAIDLAHLTGFTPETINLRQYQTIVVKVNEKNSSGQADVLNLFGLTVRRIQGISRILPDKFSPTLEAVPDILRPFAQKSVIQQSNNLLSESKGTSHTFLIDIAKLITTQIKSKI